jgi:outer membrane lipoprotein-sorting protein
MSALMRRLSGLFILLTVLAASVFADDYKTPRQVFDKMEANLMKIKNRRLKFRTEATGALTGTFEGEIIFKKGNVMDYRAWGKFAGRDHKLFLLCDGTKLRGGGENSPFEMAAPAGLRPGILIGLARMGLMHNIARLTSNKPPERTDGSVYKWLVVQDAKYAKDHAPDTPQAGATLKQNNKKLVVIFFKLGVENEKNAGDVELWIDTKTNLPAYRTITVHFPQGDMFVTEKYEWSKI